MNKLIAALVAGCSQRLHLHKLRLRKHRLLQLLRPLTSRTQEVDHKKATHKKAASAAAASAASE